MSMSTHVIGYAPPDETWQKMKAIWDACKTAGVPVPREIESFFGGGEPDPAGVEVDLPIREWSDKNGDSTGYELDVASIPPQVKTIRFCNAW